MPSNNNLKQPHRLSKKIEEVKEVIQSRTDADIIKVLEYFDNDVGKTIDAFVNDGGKEALAKWPEMKELKRQQKQQSQKNKNSPSSPQSDTANASSNNTSKSPNNRNNNKVNNNNNNNNSNINNNNNNKNSNNNNTNNNEIKNRKSTQLSSNNSSNSSRPSNNNSNKTSININDLVASVINQYTSGQPQPSPSTSSISTSNNNELNIVEEPTLNGSSSNDTTTTSTVSAQNTPNQSLIDNLNRLVISSQSSLNGGLNTNLLNGFKVTVLGVQTNHSLSLSSSSSSAILNNDSSLSSSVSSSPSSISAASTGSSTFDNSHNNLAGARPSLLDLKQNSIPQQPITRRFNTNYINPNSKLILEKHQKDLQRQTAVLNKISNSYTNQLNKSNLLIQQTFNQLRELINTRQEIVNKQFSTSSNNIKNILDKRQLKAAELKMMLDNSQHLTDQEALELKADIKHFVSERQIDEELANLNIVNTGDMDKLKHDLLDICTVLDIDSTYKYAKERPALNEILNAETPVFPKSINSPLSQSTSQHSSVVVNSKKINGHADNSNGTTNGINDSNDGFVEVKPQRNRYKQNQQAQPQQQINGHSNNNSSNAKQLTNQYANTNNNRNQSRNNNNHINVNGNRK